MPRRKLNPQEGDTPLSERQRAILRLLMAGKANKDIAAELNIGIGTVKQHMVVLFKKLNVTNRAMAISRGFAMEGVGSAAPSIASGEPDSALELRPCTVLSLSLTLSDDDDIDARDMAWRHLQAACSAATGGGDAALVGQPAKPGVDVIFGLHRVYEDNALRAIRLGRLVAARLAAELPGLPIRAGLASGTLVASMHRQGGWTGEAVAGRVIAAARDLAAGAADFHLTADGISRRLIAFARRAEGRRQTDAPESLPLLAEELPPPAHQPAPVGLLVGRAAERRQLLDLAHLAPGGGGRLIWVEGESGMGKSTLCHAFGADCRALGFQWLGARCAAPGSRLLEVLAGGAIAWTPETADTMTRTLTERTAYGPLVLMADDLHLADPAEIQAMRHLAGLLPSLPLLLLGVGRRIRHPDLAALAADGALRLTHLPTAEIAPLVAAHAPSLPAAAVSRIVAQAGGVPLFAAELAREALWSGGQPKLPLTLITLVLSRLDGLPLDRLLLAALARQKDDIRLGDMKARWPGDPARLEAEVDRATRYGILVRRPGKGVRGDHLDFHHPLVVEVLRRVLLDEQLAALDRLLPTCAAAAAVE